ncbi:MAG TPA: hypothetical protein VH062_30005 [Polyangiaceae bacterium]|jgi:hypothetical protein|nr:hypothetical protein [Polyangiaceae bacterium]
MSAESNTAEPTTDTTEPDDIDVGLIATIAIVGALLVVAIAAALTALVRSESAAYGLETGTYANLGAVKRLKIEQRAKLEGPVAWGDKAKGQVTLPIDRAMDMVQKDIQRDPYLATVAPPPGEAPAASAAPADSAAPAGSAAPAPAEKESGKTGKHTVPAGGKVDAPKGAPVTPAAASK